MSSCPNLLRVALAPSLPSSGKKLKLNFERKKKKKRVEEGEGNTQEKENYVLSTTYILSFFGSRIELLFFFLCHLLSQ